VLSSDYFRGLVADDENDQSASGDAFDVLHYVAGKRLAAGRLTVVDATNVQPHARAGLVKVAREHDVLPVAIVLDVPEALAWERTQARPDRDFGRQVLTRMHRDLRRSLRLAGPEGFRKVHVLRGVDEIAAAEIRYEKLYNDKRELTGPFDIIGDVHGCRAELETLLDRSSGYALVPRRRRPRGRRRAPPEGRAAVRRRPGRPRPGLARRAAPGDGHGRGRHAICVPGNHEQKLARKLRAATSSSPTACRRRWSSSNARAEEFAAEVRPFIDGLVSHYVLDGGKLVVAHAGLKEAYQGRRPAGCAVRAVRRDDRRDRRVRPAGPLPVGARLPRAGDRRLRPHPDPEPEWINNTICLDTGCVFGGKLTALRWPERELVSVPAAREYYAPVRPLVRRSGPARRGPGPRRRDRPPAPRLRVRPDDGRRRERGRGAGGDEPVRARPGDAGLAAADDGAVLDLDAGGLPRAPGEAFADLRAAGVGRCVRGEAHGLAGGGPGLPHGRGRRDLDPDRPAVLRPGAGRAAAGPGPGGGRAGLFDELDTDWLLLDAELLPWSAKAGGLIRDRTRASARPGRAALPAALAVLDQAAGRGARRHGAARPDRAALDRDRRLLGGLPAYVQPTDGLTGVTLAPFAVLAGAGVSYAGQGPRLAPGASRTAWSRPTRSCSPRPGGWSSTWRPGGRGGRDRLVAGADRGGRRGHGGQAVRGPGRHRRKGRLVQPGVKCRGREYLRIIYGPEYTRPEQLDRLRQRSWAASATWRCASTGWAWPRSTGWPRARRCGGCTSWSSRSWRPSRSRSTRVAVKPGLSTGSVQVPAWKRPVPWLLVDIRALSEQLALNPMDPKDLLHTFGSDRRLGDHVRRDRPARRLLLPRRLAAVPGRRGGSPVADSIFGTAPGSRFVGLLIGAPICAILGAQLGHWLGAKYGRRMFDKPDSKLFKREYVEKAEYYFEKFGPAKAVVLARFIPIVRTFLNPVAGTLGMPARQFFCVERGRRGPLDRRHPDHRLPAGPADLRRHRRQDRPLHPAGGRADRADLGAADPHRDPPRAGPRRRPRGGARSRRPRSAWWRRRASPASPRRSRRRSRGRPATSKPRHSA
jgi:predicted kinase